MQLLIEVDASGPRQLLGEMLGRVQSPRPMMALLARELEDYERDVFSTRGRGSWAPNDPDTVDLKGSGRVLVDGGNLLRQLTRARFVGDDSVVVDQGDAFYAGFLRDGKRGMPQRNAAPRPERRHVDEWADKLVRYIATGRS